jgi:hypothetical protein
MRPAAVDTISAGIWLTRPSPTVSSVKVCVASAKLMPFCATAMMMPPMTLMATIIRPAMASPRTNLLAPSMAPKKLDSSSSVLRRMRASFSSIRPDDRSASIAICLPGIASRVNRAATSAIRPEPLVMTTKFTITRIAKTIRPMTKLPPMISFPNAWIT